MARGDRATPPLAPDRLERLLEGAQGVLAAGVEPLEPRGVGH